MLIAEPSWHVLASNLIYNTPEPTVIIVTIVKPLLRQIYATEIPNVMNHYVFICSKSVIFKAKLVITFPLLN